MENIEHIDLSAKLSPIISGLRKSYGAEDYDKFSEEANEVWQFPYTENGIQINSETIEYGTHYSCKAEIRLAKGGNKLWMFSTSVMLPNQGYGIPLSVFTTIAYKNKEDAIRIDLSILQGYLKGIIQKNNPESDKKAAKSLFDKLEDSKYEQMALF